MSAPVSAPEIVAADDGRVRVTRECPECSETVEGWDRGSGTAEWKLGTHRRIKHGVKGTRGRKRKANMPTAEEHAARPVISAAREITAEIGGVGAPSGSKLGDAIGKGVWLLSNGIADIAVSRDPTIPPGPGGDPFRDELSAHLSLSVEDAAAIGRPFGGMLAKTKVNAKYGRVVVENVDVVGAAVAVVQLGLRWSEYLRNQRQLIALLQQAQPGAAVPGMMPAPVMTAQGPPPGAVIHEGTGMTMTPPMTEGRVISAADVEAARANGRAN